MDIKALKHEAFQLKKEKSIQHAEALDIIAKREGFANWMRLLDYAKEKGFV